MAKHSKRQAQLEQRIAEDQREIITRCATLMKLGKVYGFDGPGMVEQIVSPGIKESLVTEKCMGYNPIYNREQLAQLILVFRPKLTPTGQAIPMWTAELGRFKCKDRELGLAVATVVAEADKAKALPKRWYK